MERYSWIGLLYSDYDTFAIFHRQKNVQQLERNIGEALNIMHNNYNKIPVII